MAQTDAEGKQDASSSDRREGREVGYVEGAHELADIASKIDFGDDDEYDIIEMARRFAGVRKNSKENRRLKKMLKAEQNAARTRKIFGKSVFTDDSQKMDNGTVILQQPEQPAVKTTGTGAVQKPEQPAVKTTGTGAVQKPEKPAVETTGTGVAEQQTPKGKIAPLNPISVTNPLKDIAEKVGLKLGAVITADKFRELQDATFDRWNADVEQALKIKNKTERKAKLEAINAEHRSDNQTIHNELVKRIHSIDAKIEKYHVNRGQTATGIPYKRQAEGLEGVADLLNKRREYQRVAYADFARISEGVMDNIDDALDYAKFAEKRNYGIEEVDKFEQMVPNSAIATYAINTPDEVEMLKKTVPGYILDDIRESFANPNCAGTYYPQLKLAVVYSQKLEGRNDTMSKVAHENGHYAIDMLRIPYKDMEHVLDYVRVNYPSTIYQEVDANYDDYEKPEEAVTHLLEYLVNKYGLAAVLNTKLQCPNEIVNDIINSIIDFWKNGNTESYKHRQRNSGRRTENEGTLGEKSQMRLRSVEEGGRGTQGRTGSLDERAFKRAVISALGDGAEEDPDDPEPEMPTLDDNENIYDESYADKMQRYHEALRAWKERNREREEQRVEEALYSGHANNVRPTGVEALDVEALDEAEKFDEMMNGAKIDVTMKGIKRMIRDEIIERRRTIETSNWEDAVLVHKIQKATTPEQRKLIPYLLEDPVEAQEYPELADVLKEIRDWFDEVHAFMKQEGLFTRKEHDDYINNYCTHIWDFKRAEPKTVQEMRNWIRTNSPYTKERVIATIKQGTEMGLKLKYDDITDIMMEYGHYATEAVANRRLVNFLKGYSIDGSKILVEDSTKDPDYVRVDNNALDGLKVHIKVKPLIDVVFGKLHTNDNPALQNIAHVYDVVSGVQKKINLSLSFFHHAALTETALSMMGVPKFSKALFKNMIWDAALNKELPSFRDPDATMDAVKHFVSLGATQDYAAKDVNNLTAEIRKFFTDRKLYGLREGAIMADWVNRGMDTVLWDWLHDGYKIYSFKKIADEIREKARKNDWSGEKLNMALDEAGQLVNDTFGGQHWDLLGWSPNTVKWARRALLSPDWTISTIRQALSPFGIGQMYNDDAFWKKWFRKDDIATVRKKYGRIFWLNAALVFIPFYNLLNAYFRKKDEEDELAKAKEMRKSDPNYKSPYELAYPDGMKWYDYTMLGNTLGQQTHLFAGRYKNGDEMYIRWGKQFRELPELFFGRDGFSIPGPMIDKVLGKVNPLLSTTVLTMGGSLNGWESPFLKNKRGWGRTWGMIQTLISSFTPYSIPTDSEKQFVWSDLLMPSTKGFSPYKAKNYFETAIRGGDIDLVGKVYEACVKNGLNADDLYETALKDIESTTRKAATEDATDLNTAVEMYDKSDSPKERQTLRNKIKKYLGAQDYKQIERSELIEKAENVINGETVEKGSTKKYDMISTSNDVIEDWKLSKIVAGFKQWEDERDDIRDSEGAEAARLYMLNHKDIFKKLGEVKAIQSQIRGLKKGLGKGDETNDKKIMEQIRKVRDKAFIN